VRTAVTTLQMLVRVTGVLQLVLGVLFWTGNALGLVDLHQLIGIVIVLSLWTLAALAHRAGVQPGLVALAGVWGLVTVVLGLTQRQLLPEGGHVVIEVLHLLVGLGAIGLADALATRAKARLAPVA
jgi:hypothetical protein